MGYTYRQKFNKKYNQNLGESNSLDDISKLTKIKKSILQKVYNRGVGAWKTNIESVRMKDGSKNYKVTDRSKKMTKEQWGIARVYSFVMGGKTAHTADKDLAINANTKRHYSSATKKSPTPKIKNKKKRKKETTTLRK